MHRDLVILGSGPAGLACAASSSAEYLLIDAADQFGGLTRIIDEPGAGSFQPALSVLLPTDSEHVHSDVEWQPAGIAVYQEPRYAPCGFMIAPDGLPADADPHGVASAILEKVGLPRDAFLAVRRGPAQGRSAEFAVDTKAVAELFRAVPSDRGTVWTSAPLEELDVDRQTLQVRGYPAVPYERLVSTIPLTELVERTVSVPDRLREIARQLRSSDSLIVGIGLGRRCTEHHWLYYPQPDIVFHRVTVVTNLLPDFAPGRTHLNVEIASSSDRPVPRAGILREVLNDLIRVRLLRPTDQILHASVFEAACTYPVDDAAAWAGVAEIRSWYERQGVYTAGRGGTWRRMSVFGAIRSGVQAASRALPARGFIPASEMTPFAAL